ncbi:hypothetical protein EDB85DRAFT_288200 [Lactarius pseudohatsudake]|nr:hypothetical protein EDB85DRAFT_288200 [Lactarius pseudohatsudake]
MTPSCLQQLYDIPRRRVSQSCLPSRAFFSNLLIRLTLGICQSEQLRPKTLTSLLSIIQFVGMICPYAHLYSSTMKKLTGPPRCGYSTVSFHWRHITKTDAVLKNLELAIINFLSGQSAPPQILTNTVIEQGCAMPARFSAPGARGFVFTSGVFCARPSALSPLPL